MNSKLFVSISIKIKATSNKVWDALVNPAHVQKYMLGAKQISDYKKGSPIVWQKESNGKEFEDHGIILEVIEGKKLKYTHYTPLSNKPDTAENTDVVTVKLKTAKKRTTLMLLSENIQAGKEKTQTRAIWDYYLQGLKIICEQ